MVEGAGELPVAGAALGAKAARLAVLLEDVEVVGQHEAAKHPGADAVFGGLGFGEGEAQLVFHAAAELRAEPDRAPVHVGHGGRIAAARFAMASM